MNKTFGEITMEDLNCKSLMIGDWVIYKGKPTMIYEIDDDYHRINTEPDGYDSIRYIEISDINPIPITIEIFEKNGFVAEGDNFKMWTSADKRVILHNNDGYLNTFNKWHVHVDTEDMRTIGCVELTYVHQFQQFLRLCGMNELADNFKI